MAEDIKAFARNMENGGGILEALKFGLRPSNVPPSLREAWSSLQQRFEDMRPIMLHFEARLRCDGGLSTVVFGPWVDPELTNPEVVAPPIGAPCLYCGVPFVKGDSGLEVFAANPDPCARFVFAHSPAHYECRDYGREPCDCDALSPDEKLKIARMLWLETHGWAIPR